MQTNSTSWGSRCLRWLAGSHPAVRRHSLYCLAAGQFYAVNAGVMYQAAWLGMVPLSVAQWLSAGMLLTLLVFFALVRSGWSQRFADPVLTLPHAMVSELLTVAAYALIGPARGDVVLLMGQVIALSMFRLRPQATMFLGAWTVGWLLAIQGWLVYAQEPGFDGVRALAHVLVSTSGLLAMSLVAMWISAMRSRISSQAKKLRHTLLQAQALATTDGLTGLLNRRRMLEHLDEELAQAAQTRRPVCVAIIDLDHFKRINDWHGHRAGDEVLQGFSAFALRQLRQVDKLARWGGEEFLLLLPHVQHEQARVALERLCQQVAQQPMGEQHPVPITVSVGLAQWTPGEDLACWLDRADRALYEAKQSGRNRCVVAMSPEPVKAQAATSAATPAELMLVREASR